MKPQLDIDTIPNFNPWSPVPISEAAISRSSPGICEVDRVEPQFSVEWFAHGASLETQYAVRLVGASREMLLEDADTGERVSHESWAAVMLRTLSSLMPAGCSSTPGKGAVHPGVKKEPGLGEIVSDGELSLRVEMMGDSKVGKLLIFRQTSLAGDLLPLETLSSEQLKELGERERKTFLLLEKINARHIFEEGRPRDLLPGDRSALLLRADKLLISQGLRIDARDSARTREAKSLLALAILGGAFFYALQHPEVHLHRTMNAEEEKASSEFTLEYLKKHRGDWRAVLNDPNFHKRVEVPKEIWAVRELSQFYKDNPGSNPTLIFGRSYRLCDKLQNSGTAPRVIASWWQEPGEKVDAGLPAVCK